MKASKLCHRLKWCKDVVSANEATKKCKKKNLLRNRKRECGVSLHAQMSVFLRGAKLEFNFGNTFLHFILVQIDSSCVLDYYVVSEFFGLS